MTPTGGVYWINPNQPTQGYLTDPTGKPAGSVQAYPIDYITWLLRPMPPTATEVRSATTGEQSRLIGGMAINGKIGLLYGQRKIAPSVFYGPRVNIGGSQMTVGFGLSHGPCDSLVGTTFADGRTAAALGGFYIQTFYPGSLTPASADPNLANAAGESMTNFERHPGLCYVSATFGWDPTAWENLGSLPIPIFELRGRVVYDYRTGLYVWSDNPALCLADYITSRQYGRCGVVNVQSVIDAANYCDVLVLNTVTGLNEKRHRLNYFIMRGAYHKSHMDAMRAHFRCNVIERGGEFIFIIDQDSAPVMSFDPSTAQPVSIERLAPSSTPNQVGVSFPDPAKANDEMTPAFARTSGVEAGTSVIKPADYELEGCVTNFHAASEAFYLLNVRLANLRVVLRSAHPQAMRLEPMDVIQYTTPAYGMTNFKLRVLRVTRAADGSSWLIETAGHNPAIYAFQMRAVETNPLPALPNANGTPAAPPAPTLTQVGFDLQVDFVPVAGYPYYGGQVIQVQRGTDAPYLLGPPSSSGPLMIRNVSMGIPYVISARVYNLLGTPSAFTAAPTFTPSMTAIPNDVINLSTAVRAPSDGEPFGAATAVFGAASLRSATLYGAAALTATNLQNYTAARVNDGNLALTCFDWNIAGASQIVFDLGAAKIIREWWVYYSAIFDPFGTPSLAIQISWSDTGVAGPWTLANVQVMTQAAANLRIWTLPQSIAAHRYWKISKFSTNAEASTFTEIWPREYTGVADTNVHHYNVYSRDASSGGRKLIGQIQKGFEPTATNPFDVNAAAVHIPQMWPIIYEPGVWYTNGVDIIVTAVSKADPPVESYGVEYSQLSRFMMAGNTAQHLPQFSAAVTVFNGANPNMAVPIGPGTIELSGPSAAFSVGGFQNPASGAMLPFFYMGAQLCTIKNEDAGTTAANRIKTLTGADITVQGPCVGLFEYSGDASRWVLVALRDTGAWTSFVPVLTAASGTWTGGAVLNAKYRLDGKTMFVNFKITGSTVSVATLFLNVTIPGGFTSAGEMGFPASVSDNGVPGSGWVATSGAGGTGMTVFKDILASVSFAASAANTAVQFNLRFEVQ